MTREWKPGDVASATRAVGVGGLERGVYLRSESRLPWTGADNCSYAEAELYDLRPLVVIDPEDREQVERLYGRFVQGDKGNYIGNVDDMQAALRSLVAPPKPDEPTGLGAVVEDAKGHRWVRVDAVGDRKDHSNWVDAFSAEIRWDAIDAVRVLSEGVIR